MEIGKAITKYANFISQVGVEIEAMVKLIKQELSSAVATASIKEHMKPVGDWESKTRYSEEEWVVIDYAFSLGMKPAGKGKSSVVRWLSFQISLAGEGTAAEGNEEPLLHICWFDSPINFEEDFCYMGFPLDEDDNPELENKVLFNWTPDAKKWSEQQWAFSLRLTSLNTLDDIENKIIRPTVALLSGKTPIVALPLTLDGLVCYEKIGDTLGQYKITSCAPEK